MADIPPVSDPQIAALIEQGKSRRRRLTLIFGSVGIVLVIAFVGSSLYFSAQGKKKRNVAYSRVVKCLFGKPLDSGEAPMTRVRSAWRARILAQKSDDKGDLEQQEAKDTAEWPNRCVSQMIAFTDTLKEIGDMKEGEKDLGFYSRELSKQTAGSNWKNVDTYQAAVESFVGEAQKGNFEFVDVPDVKAPELAEAQPIDAAFPKTTALEDTHLDADAHVLVVGTAARFYAPAGKGKPARLCTTSDGKELACNPMTWLPPEASGIPWVLSADDGAQPLMAFGRRGGIATGSSVSTGVFRVSDGAAVIAPDAFYVAGGFVHADGSSALLLKDAREPDGDHFKIAHLTATATKPQLDASTLTEWNEQPDGVAMVGSYVLWVTASDQLRARSIDAKDAPVVTLATLPGALATHSRKGAFDACLTKKGTMVAVRTRADGLVRVLVMALSATPAPGDPPKPQVTDDGDLSCTDDAAVITSDDAVATCTGDGACNSVKLERPKASGESLMTLGGVVVRVSKPSGLLRVEWQKDGKPVATKVFDAQMKGTVLLGEAKLGHLELVGRRTYGLLFLDIGGTQHVARVDAAGAIAPVAVKL